MKILFAVWIALTLCAYTPRTDRKPKVDLTQKYWKIVDVVKYGEGDVGVLYEEMGGSKRLWWERPARIYRKPEGSR